VNVHPALLPDFGGKGMYGNRVHAAVIEAGVSRSGITIH
jgi:phosphoribosylglycinamide formyltransferase-1